MRAFFINSNPYARSTIKQSQLLNHKYASFTYHEQYQLKYKTPKIHHGKIKPIKYQKNNIENEKTLEERIISGEFSQNYNIKLKQIQDFLLVFGPTGGKLISSIIEEQINNQKLREELKIPEAKGNVSEAMKRPIFEVLYVLYNKYGGIFKLNFGPKYFVIISEPEYVQEILVNQVDKFSKGLLGELLDFVMGKGLIPADGEIWKTRRRAIVPAIHKKYVERMLDMFVQKTEAGLEVLRENREKIEMENFFSKLALDIIGNAVFNYDFDCIASDDPIIKAVYTVLKETEYRSVMPFAWWDLPLAKVLHPRQRKVVKSLKIINETLNRLIEKSQKLINEENVTFTKEYVNNNDPSILHFLLASGEEVTGKQLRDDLMTLLIAGHETSAAVLTWTFYELSRNPEIIKKAQKEIDEKIGNSKLTMENIMKLKYCIRIICEGLRLYPQPPVLIRRTLEPVKIGKYQLSKNDDIFISVWNLHRSSKYWHNPNKFEPERFDIDNPLPNEITEKYNYLPFGGGRRKCIGEQFAMYETVIAMVMILREFDIICPKDAPDVSMVTGATIHAENGLYLKLSPRHKLNYLKNGNN